MNKKLTLAIQDFKRAMLQHRVWLHLGWAEVKQRYRRSVIGPWWVSLSMLIFIAMMGVVFSRLFHQDLKEYIPFFTAGFLFWTFISTSIVEAAEIFRVNGPFIKQINLPYNIYTLKHLVRQTIFLAHNFAVYIIVCFFFKFIPGWKVLLVIPGFLLLALNVYWISLFAGIICSRFRDMVPIISSCVQIAFFITPISWMPKLLDQNPGVIKYNPLSYLLDIVRSPLLGIAPADTSWLVTGVLAALGCSATFALFSSMRSRIAFWVD